MRSDEDKIDEKLSNQSSVQVNRDLITPGLAIAISTLNSKGKNKEGREDTENRDTIEPRRENNLTPENQESP